MFLLVVNLKKVLDRFSARLNELLHSVNHQQIFLRKWHLLTKPENSQGLYKSSKYDFRVSQIPFQVKNRDLKIFKFCELLTNFWGLEYLYTLF